MKAKGGNWTFDELNEFLANPRGDVPGTNMTFAGISRGEQRADLIDYLRTQSDNPEPLPKAAEAPAAERQAADAPAPPKPAPRRLRQAPEPGNRHADRS